MSELLEKIGDLAGMPGGAPETEVEAETEAEAAGRCAGLTPFLDPLRVPSLLSPGARESRDGITVELRDTWVRLHSQLPPTRVWAYGGHFPGPTIEARRGGLEHEDMGMMLPFVVRPPELTPFDHGSGPDSARGGGRIAD